MKFDDSLTDQLSRIADEPGPPSTVDLDRAVAEARRTTRARRATGVAVGTVVVALVSALAVTAVGGGAPDGANGQPTASPSAPATRPAQSDPLTVPAAFTTLPSGFVFQAVTSEPSLPEGLAVYDPETGQSASLSVSPAGQTPARPSEVDGLASPVAAPPVGGDPAYWYQAPGSLDAGMDNQVQLIWKYAANQWVELEFSGTGTISAITGLVYQLADSVRFGTPTAYPLPLRVTPPAGLPVTDATYSVPSANGGWRASIVYGQNEVTIAMSGIQPSTGGGTQSAGAVASGHDFVSQPPGAHTTIDGCTSVVSTGPPLELWTAQCDGLAIDIKAFGAGVQALQQYGGLVGFFNSIAWLGPDQANWTTDVIN
ncbi:MAG TPA: hypothetical protein VGM10_35190 [Actinocrinis sp.]